MTAQLEKLSVDTTHLVGDLLKQAQALNDRLAHLEEPIDDETMAIDLDPETVTYDGLEERRRRLAEQRLELAQERCQAVRTRIELNPSLVEHARKRYEAAVADHEDARQKAEASLVAAGIVDGLQQAINKCEPVATAYQTRQDAKLWLTQFESAPGKTLKPTLTSVQNEAEDLCRVVLKLPEIDRSVPRRVVAPLPSSTQKALDEKGVKCFFAPTPGR